MFFFISRPIFFYTKDLSSPLTDRHEICTQVWCGVKPCKQTFNFFLDPKNLADLTPNFEVSMNCFISVYTGFRYNVSRWIVLVTFDCAIVCCSNFTVGVKCVFGGGWLSWQTYRIIATRLVGFIPWATHGTSIHSAVVVRLTSVTNALLLTWH